MREIVLVAASGGVPFGVHLDVDSNENGLQTLHVNLGDSSKLALEVLERMDIPDELLDTNGTRLLTFAEMRQKVINKRGDLEQSWHALVDRCTNVNVTLRKSGGGAVLINGVEVISGATLESANFTLNLRAHLAEAAELRAALVVRMICTVTLPTGKVSTLLRLEIVVDGTIPRFTFSIPELPFRLPEISWPDFDWARLSRHDLTWADIRLPALPFLPVQISCDNAVFDGRMQDGKLRFELKVTNVTLALNGQKAAWGDITVIQQDTGLQFGYLLTFPTLSCNPSTARLPGPLDTLELVITTGTLDLQAKQIEGAAKFQGVFKTQLTLRSHAQPAKAIDIEAELPFRGENLVNSLDLGGGQASTRSIRLVQADVPLESLVADLPDRFSICLRFGSLPMAELRVIAELFAEVLATLGHALAGLARVIQRAMEAIASRLVEALSAVEVTLVLERGTGNLQQVLISVHRSSKDGELKWERMGFSVTVPAEVDVAVLADLRKGRRDAYVVITSESATNVNVASIATDLWLGTATTERPIGELSSRPGKKPHLIEVDIARKESATGRVSVVPFGVRAGRATFLHALNPPLPELSKSPSLAFTGFELVSISDQFNETFRLASDAKERLLPFLSAPKEEPSSGGGDIAETLKQYIKIIDFDKPTMENGLVHANLDVEINALGSKLDTSLRFEIDPCTLTARIQGGAIAITVPKDFELLGMKASFVDAKTGQPVEEKQVVLDLSSSDPRLYLNDGVSLQLKFDKLSTAGKPLEFRVDKLVMHGGGLDLDAALAAEATVPLNGLGTDYTFKAARLSVRDGRVSAFALTATGKLPPALLGDVDTRIYLNFALRNGTFVLSDGSLELVNKGKPIRSEQTHFVFTLDGLAVRAFEDDGSLHFCAFVSGSALFKPEVAELAEGMFQKLAGVELSFTNCPVCGASKVIEREMRNLNLSFIVALNEPARATLFDLYDFDVRSIGLEPSCKMWNDTPPAIVIGGQVTFAETGDVVRAECDFHKLYIAPPSKGFLPRIKCEGLGVAIRLGSAFEVEGKVVAVDGRMPDNVLESRPPENSLQANGFMGQGRVAIEGLPPIAASFGFVEVRETPESKPLRAWFVYLEAQHLSYHFQLGPIPIYLREAGLGLGFHFTYVGIKEIDEAASLPAAFLKLDEIAANAQEPAKLDSWLIDKRKGLTLVARAMISMSSASAPTEALVWKPEEEKELPNILLLNVVMAMRNTTFMMTANAWLGWNYSDWDVRRKIGGNELVGKQAMTGYVVLVGSRSEFLARLRSNPGAEVGDRLALPDAFKNALRDQEYDADLYMRPGLLQVRLGLGNTLRFTENIAGANLSVVGGAVFRMHEGTLLAGLNLEGRLDFSMSGRLDAGAVGIAVSASVHAELIARMIGYLDPRRVSNSLYYSLFSLQVRVKFAVSAWLEIKAWMCKITIRASFSLSLQIDVLAELAIAGDGSMGTRARATIAVSIFGRSLGLSVGLSANAGLVSAASARASRFLQVELEQNVPAVAPPVSQQNDTLQKAAGTGEERRKAQAVAASANSHDDSLAPAPIEEVIPKEFSDAVERKRWQNICYTDFQVLATYPTVLPLGLDPEEWVYLTFVPLDAIPGGTHTSSFYATPQSGASVDLDHCVVFSGLASKDGDVLRWDGSAWMAMSIEETKLVKTRVAWDKTLDYEESTRQKEASPEPDAGPATLRDLFFAAFRSKASSADESGIEYFEPQVRPKRTFSEVGRRAADNLGEAHLEQQRRYASVIEQDPADRRCYEARDFLLHKFFSDLFAYGETATRLQQEVHVLDLGLTFLVRRSALKGPVVGYVKKRVVVEGQTDWRQSKDCEIFNPPWKTFEAEPPRFESRYSDTTAGKVRLDWELDWGLGAVEDYLQCYEIRRSINLDGREIDSPLIRFKRADGDSVDDKTREIVRNEWQFTDEFDDLSPADRRELTEAMGKAVIRYAITPICVSNTRGRLCSAFILRFGGHPELGAPRKATATFTLDPVATTPKTRLQIAIAMEADAPALRAGERFWQLTLRPEEIVPSGQYGVDAETQSSLGSWLSSSDVSQPGDVEILVPAGKPNDAALVRLEILNDDPMADQLRQILIDTANPQAWRIIARQVVLLDRKGEPKKDAFFSSTPSEVEIGVQLVSARATAGQPAKDQDHTFLKPGRFEYIRQPQQEERHVLLPVFADQIAPVESGRAVLPLPNAGQVLYGPHPEFGAATRLTWNVVPSDTVDAALLPYRMLAGFDIWRLDLDSATLNTQDWKRAWRVTSTRLLSRDKIALLPAEIGEVSNWKASYPSELARRRANGTWYSEAESFIEWPRLEPRLEPLPEPSQDLLTSLLSKGVPDVIRLSMHRDPQPQQTPEPSRTPPDITWAFKLRAGASEPVDQVCRLENGNELHFDVPSGIGAESLRSALRRLEATLVDVNVAGVPSAQLQGWRLELACLFRPREKAIPLKLHADEVSLAYDRDLHPLLESIITRMRRRLDRLLDADRRPPPVLKSATADAFVATTGGADDPYGWLVMERLGLGVTLRLYDAFNDTFLDHKDLREQLEKALQEVRDEGIHSEARRHLTVEWLLKPGAMVHTVPFESRPDADGNLGGEDEDRWLRDNALDMVRISVRPRMTQAYAYRVGRFSSAALRDFKSANFDAMLYGDIAFTRVTDTQDLKALLDAADARSREPRDHWVFMRSTESFGGLDSDEDNAPGSGSHLPDVYGRFPAADWHQNSSVLTQVDRFQVLLSRSLNTKLPPKETVLPDWWLRYNQRFFEHAAATASSDSATFAYAATEVGEPATVAANRYGQVSIVLPEADGYAHQFAYAVRPRWRYEALLEAAGHAVPDDQAREIADAGPQYSIATVERTAPVLPPALISLGRIGDGVWWKRDDGGLVRHRPGEKPAGMSRLGSDAGLSSVVLLPHHPERRLSRSNTPAQRALSHAGELYTQVATLVDPAWCKAFLQKDPDDLTAREKTTTEADVSAIDELDPQDRSLPPFDRARLRVVSYLPHWYRHLAVAAAASGSAVSVPAAAYLAEPAARLVMIDPRDGAMSIVDHHPWKGRTTIDSTAIETMNVQASQGLAHAEFGATFDLLRYFDTTDKVTAELWQDAVAAVPDPGVTYQIDLVVPAKPAQGEPRRSVTPIARIVRDEGKPSVPFKVVPISKEWRVGLEQNGLALRVSLSPYGKGLSSQGLPEKAFPAFNRDADGALRVPGGWSLGWLTELLAQLPEGSAEQELAWAAQLWKRLGSDAIGVAVDDSFYGRLAAAQVGTMEVTQPADETERKEISDALLAWADQQPKDSAQRLIVQLVRDRTEAALQRWPDPGKPLTMEIPWLTSMAPPKSAAVTMAALGTPRHLLPDLMTQAEVDLLAGVDRAQALWASQKQQAVGADGQLVITALRGDAVPLQLNPFQLV